MPTHEEIKAIKRLESELRINESDTNIKQMKFYAWTVGIFFVVLSIVFIILSLNGKEEAFFKFLPAVGTFVGGFGLGKFFK